MPCDGGLVLALQGFDKYGIGAYDGLPVPNLMKALGLKVRSAETVKTTAGSCQLAVPP